MKNENGLPFNSIFSSIRSVMDILRNERLVMRMSKRSQLICLKALHGSTKGAALIEVVIATVILGLTVSAVTPGLVLITKAQFSWSEQRTAESLTRNQIEYIKAATYIYGNGTDPQPQYDEVPKPNESYDINITAQPVDSESLLPLPSGDDDGIQEITVQIYHVDRLVLETTTLKVDRLDLFAL